jgi:hypothetical protein
MNEEQLKAWRVAGREFLSADMPVTVNAAERTVDVVWFTGADVPRIDWWTGDEYMLHFDPKGADLSKLNLGAPVLDGHNSYDGAAGQMGKVERAWFEAGLYKATLRFSKRKEVDGLWTDLTDGIVTKFSMGVEFLEIIEQRDAMGKLTSKTATKWRPFEISTVPVPADFGTTTLSAARPVVAAIACATREREVEILSLR